MVLRPVSDLRVVTRDGAALFGIDANCHEPLWQGGLPLRAIWHNEDIAVPSQIKCAWTRFSKGQPIGVSSVNEWLVNRALR